MDLPWKITDDFPDLEEIDIQALALSLGKNISLEDVGNKLANLLLYPQVVPETPVELTFQLAVLKEALRKEPKRFYNPSSQKLIIPERFLTRFPNLLKLVETFLDAIPLNNLTTVYFNWQRLGQKVIGTIITPEILGLGAVSLEVDQKRYTAKAGTLIHIETTKNRVDFKFASSCVKLLGRDMVVAEVAGGQIGLFIDLRKVHNG